MRTQLMITIIVGAIGLALGGAVYGLVAWLGWLPGLAVSILALGVLLVGYLTVIKPWHVRWGATDDEVAMMMPGDELLPDAPATTRSITVRADPQAVWPWLVQIGYGKAGWYSYDWIDNDFRRSAERIVPEFQDLTVGDRILMTPQLGFRVMAVDPPHSIVSMLDDGTTSWCLALYPTGDGSTRLVSRWRPELAITPATLFFVALSEPGTFIMEQKMLRTIRSRVERSLASDPTGSPESHPTRQ